MSETGANAGYQICKTVQIMELYRPNSELRFMGPSSESPAEGLTPNSGLNNYRIGLTVAIGLLARTPLR